MEKRAGMLYFAIFTSSQNSRSVCMSMPLLLKIPIKRVLAKTGFQSAERE